jgi:hypothetical protein
MGAFFGFLGWAGYRLGSGHPDGIRLSLLAQGLQIPRLFTAVVTYSLYGPLAATVELGVEAWRVGFNVEVGGGGSLGLGGPMTETIVGVNIAAVIVLGWLAQTESPRQLPTSGGLVTR